ncbi:unnamed protein product [Rotaria sp. Silwood2]|nr:unnamed protein product [Rotaria sp. Silwood2]CAF2796605.1 unnamed protein product [Rotaria sp. Silwood2]CAF3910272.1 unnamed protein product [Rotaria sp. Silwood2]CAF3983938.1 unnamed protein product [Rotaria sp. Silwood2]
MICSDSAQACVKKSTDKSDSIVIKASQSIFVKAFDQILREKYFFSEIRQSVNYADVHITELEELINEELNLLPEAIILFQDIKNDNREMINYLKMPLQEPCNYANGNDTETLDIVIGALDLVHQQMRKLIDTIRNDFLSQITPWQNSMLMNKTLEDKVQWYVRLVVTILLVLIVILGLIPIVFFILIIICRMCHQLLGANSNDLVIDGLDVQTVFTSIIDDCRNHIHFSEYFFKTHLIRLENHTYHAMNRLNEKIFDKFNFAIASIDIQSDLNHLAAFSVAINSIKIQKKVQQIEEDLKTIETRFEKISTMIPTLPPIVVNQTVDNVSITKFYQQ